jgi:hypothetical protein
MPGTARIGPSRGGAEVPAARVRTPLSALSAPITGLVKNREFQMPNNKRRVSWPRYGTGRSMARRSIDSTMDFEHVRQRLAHARAQEAAEASSLGYDAGFAWAGDDAGPSELLRLIDEEVVGKPLAPNTRWGWLREAYPSLPDFEDDPDCVRTLEVYEEEFIEGFIKGATAVFEEVRKLE